MINKEEYEKDLKIRQNEHLRKIKERKDLYWKPCLHEQCPKCLGTGMQLNGEECIHYYKCDCPKCQHVCAYKHLNDRPIFTPKFSGGDMTEMSKVPTYHRENILGDSLIIVY